MANDEYMTPVKYIPSIRNVLGADFTDLFSSGVAQQRINAKRYFTRLEDAFNFQWLGKCYANPPYSRGNLPIYSARIIKFFDKGRVVESISLLPNSTNETWFQNLAKHEQALTCLTDHRIKFTTFENQRFCENSSPDFGNAFIYLGYNPDNFIREFSKWGTIVKAIDIEKGLINDERRTG